MYDEKLTKIILLFLKAENIKYTKNITFMNFFRVWVFISFVEPNYIYNFLCISFHNVHNHQNTCWYFIGKKKEWRPWYYFGFNINQKKSEKCGNELSKIGNLIIESQKEGLCALLKITFVLLSCYTLRQYKLAYEIPV